MSQRKRTTRPNIYNAKKHPEKAAELLSLGHTVDRVCKALEISRRSFYNWRKAHEEFDSAVTEAMEIVDDSVEEALLKSSTGVLGDEQVAPNFNSMKFWLMNRRPEKWRDKREVVAEVKITDLSEEEINAKLKALLSES